MLKKITYILSAVMLCSCVLLVPSFESNASGVSSSQEFYVNYCEPDVTDNSGYLAICFYNPSAKVYGLNVFFWNFKPHDPSSGAYYSMGVDITSSTVTFTPDFSSNVQFYNYLLCEFGTSDDLYILKSGLYKYNESVGYTRNYGTYGNSIVGYTYSGNLDRVTSTFKGTSPLIHWNNSVDGVKLDNKLNEILGKLNNIDSDTTSIVNKLQDIYNQNVDTNTKLDSMNNLLNEIKAKQTETNTWLEKIFDYLQESQEKQKQEAQTQGNSSVSQGSSAIEDKGGDFAGSLSSLTDSMSYTGTNCSWTFPTVKLPAIPGVMDEVTLIESQPIDFTFWVNAIPSGIMLIIQSVLTIGLIVYCFKELYSTIAYVLTLRKDDNS